MFSARDSHRLTWAQINNVSNGGVFLDGPRSLTIAGADGLVNTADDGAIETLDMHGHNVTLASYTREIAIEDVPARTVSSGRSRSRFAIDGQILTVHPSHVHLDLRLGDCACIP